MPTLLSRYATPLVTGLFLVSLISGIALFFHVGMAAFRGMHEWLSMVLILPFLLHVWKNWRPLLGYLKRPPMAIALGLSLAASLAFAWPSLTGQGAGQTAGNPQFALIGKVTGALPAAVAALYNVPEQDFLARLKDKGFTAAASGIALKDIAIASGRSERELVAALVTLGK